MGLVSRIQTVVRNVANKVKRPSVVTYAQRKHVQLNPSCAACGSTSGIQGHHIKPFNKFPELAASPNNFVSMCETGIECHLHVAHGGNFKFYNPDVLNDAAAFRQANDPARRIILDNIRSKRLVDAP